MQRQQRALPPVTVGKFYIHLYSHKLQLQKQEIKKTEDRLVRLSECIFYFFAFA